jgi:hypothetical protein
MSEPEFGGFSGLSGFYFNIAFLIEGFVGCHKIL